jgi:hypothetical protein
MAKAEGELGLKISGFQAALSKASHLMKEFGEHAKETAGKAGEQLHDVMKDTGHGNLANMIGLGGASVAVTAFSAAVVETVKKASEAFEDFETSSMQMGLLVGNAKVGEEIEEWIHGLEGAGGHVEDLTAGMKQFVEAGLSIEEAKTKLLEYQKLSIATGDSMESLAQSFRKVKAGGLDAGEGAARFLKSPLMLGLATEEKNRDLAGKREAAQSKLQLDTVYHGMNSPEVAKDKETLAAVDAQLKETTADWVKAGNLTSKVLDSILARVTGPGGQYEHAVQLQGATEHQKKEDVGEAFNEELRKLGESMSTGFKPALDELIKDLPKLDGFVRGLGDTLGQTTLALVKMTQMDLLGLKGGSAESQAYDILHGAGAYKALGVIPTGNAVVPGGPGFPAGSPKDVHTEQLLAAVIAMRQDIVHLLTGGMM